MLLERRQPAHLDKKLSLFLAAVSVIYISEYFRVGMVSVNPEFLAFPSINGCTRPNTVFLPLLRLQQGGGFSSAIFHYCPQDQREVSLSCGPVDRGGLACLGGHEDYGLKWTPATNVMMIIADNADNSRWRL